MTTVSAPPREAPFRPGDFRRLWKLAEKWGATYRYRPAAAELEEALQEIEGGRDRGPDFFDATIRGDSIPEMRAAALEKAQEFYGPAADLVIISIGTVNTMTHYQPRASILVRCLNYAEVSP